MNHVPSYEQHILSESAELVASDALQLYEPGRTSDAAITSSDDFNDDEDWDPPICSFCTKIPLTNFDHVSGAAAQNNGPCPPLSSGEISPKILNETNLCPRIIQCSAQLRGHRLP